MYELRVREQNDENPVLDGITELLTPTWTAYAWSYYIRFKKSQSI